MIDQENDRFINQKMLIHRRFEFGIKTIAEAKQIQHDKEHRKLVRGVKRTEYLYSINRLNKLPSAIDRQIYIELIDCW